MIGADAVVSKDIHPYAIAVGCPNRIVRYRFPEEIRNKLLEIQWWNFSEENLKDVTSVPLNFQMLNNGTIRFCNILTISNRFLKHCLLKIQIVLIFKML